MVDQIAVRTDHAGVWVAAQSSPSFHSRRGQCFSNWSSTGITWCLEITLVSVSHPWDCGLTCLDETWALTIFKKGIHTEETRIERDTCTPMLIAALFIIARTWKQPRCPSADEWIRKLWYIYTMEYYSAIIKNTFESILMRWMKLELIIQSEVSQKEKHQYNILMHIYGI